MIPLLFLLTAENPPRPILGRSGFEPSSWVVLILLLARKDFSEIEPMKVPLGIEARNERSRQFGGDQVISINDSAFDMEKALLDQRGLHLQRRNSRQSLFFEFVPVPAGGCSAILATSFIEEGRTLTVKSPDCSIRL